MNILLATIIGLTFSARTPNVVCDGGNCEASPIDYELAVKVSKEEGKFQYFAKRDWERESGIEYVDTEFEMTQKIFPYYVGVKHIDKQSKDYGYSQGRLGLSSDIIDGGLAFTEEETIVNVTFKKVLKENTLEYKIYIDFTTNFYTEIWGIKSEARKYLTKYVNVFASFNKEFYNGHIDEQYKVGLGVKF